MHLWRWINSIETGERVCVSVSSMQGWFIGKVDVGHTSKCEAWLVQVWTMQVVTPSYMSCFSWARRQRVVMARTPWVIFTGAITLRTVRIGGQAVPIVFLFS